MNHGHLSDDDIELYCLNRLPAAATTQAEEHLLLCVSCQLRCQDMQIYVNTLRKSIAGPTAPVDNPRPKI